MLHVYAVNTQMLCGIFLKFVFIKHGGKLLVIAMDDKDTGKLGKEIKKHEFHGGLFKG
jgi:hypothetical protein